MKLTKTTWAAVVIGLVFGLGGSAFARDGLRGTVKVQTTPPAEPPTTVAGCGDHRQECHDGDQTWCCDIGTRERPICCERSNRGCSYCFE